ncbi:hypothetical protein IW152_003960 [Coemansia sp. BCRC 34962]|nr:hypothetical protein IW152_003960 [Coemansia sp. BCRC 34962]
MANDSASSAVGFLQKKNRFYGWNKSDSLFRASGNGKHNSELPFQIIGNVNGYDLRQIARAKSKQLIESSDIFSVTAQSTKDIVIATGSNGTVVLRAQTSADRDAWLHTLQSIIANYATNAADIPEFHGDAGLDVGLNPAVAVPRAAPYIPTWTMSSSSVSGSIAKKLNLGLPGLELRLNSSSEADVTILDSKRINVNSVGDDTTSQPPLPVTASPVNTEPLELEDFDASAFFANDSQLSCDFPLVASVARSKSTVYNRTRNFITKSQAEIQRSLPAPPKVTTVSPLARPDPPALTYPALASTGNGMAGVGVGSMDFSSMFDFLLEPRTESTPAHVEASLRQLAPSLQKIPETLTVTPQTPQRPRLGETLAQSTHVPTAAKQEAPTTTAAATELNGFGGSNMRPLDMESDNYLPESAESASINVPCRGLAGANSAVAQPAARTALKTTESVVVLTPSVADYAGSLLDNMGLAAWSCSLEQAPEHATHTQIASEPNSNPLTQSSAAGQQQAAGTKGTDQQALTTKLLNSPEHHRLGGRNTGFGKSTISTSARDTSSKRLTFDGSSVGLSGIQAELLSKYSDSLSSSRALLPVVGRASRAKHDWRTNVGGTNRQHFTEQPAAPIQYAPVEPANTGISKVIRGQIAKDIIQKEADSRPANRRMRRVKSEAKIAPLKSIRLRLDGSTVGSRTSINQTRNSAKRGMGYVVKDGLIRDAGSRSDQRLGASQVAEESSKNQSPDVFGEFNEIRARLQMAEEKKRQQQRASMSDRDGADNVRIADIIENRQDIPLAAQLEERRKMQLAKQQILIQQQLVQQHQQMEQQRALMEQQQQHQLFKRQSLHPSLNSASQVSLGAAAYPGQQGGWQGYGGGGNYADQWIQQQSIYGSTAPTPTQFQSSRPRAYQNSQAAASVSEASYQSMDIYGRPLGRSFTTNARPQPGAALYKNIRPSSAAARSLHSPQSHVSSESWQSRAAPSMSTGVPARANTEINFDGSDCSVSPISSVMPPRRTMSYGLSSHQRLASQRSGSFSVRPRAKGYAMGKAPPVPPLPQASAVTGPGHKAPFQEYAYPPPHGPPGYMSVPVADQGGHGYRQQAYSSQWAAGQPRAHVWAPHHGPLPPSQAVLARHSTYSQGYPGGDYAKQASEAQMLAEMHKISKKRTEMAADTPSLLQRLDNARTTGLLPGRHAEKRGYSQGAYQNQSVTRQIRDASSAQYLGNGNSLLIDRVYESEKSRSAFLKKISRTYTGIGGDVAPATTFTH